MKSPLIALGFLFVATTSTFAQDATKHNMAGMNHAAMMGQDGPKEGGQSAFAAIQEIVALLDADLKTDWSKVNIEALRQHLIDMNNVTLGSVVVTTETAQTIAFKVSGEGSVKDSIRRMVMAHAKTMNGVEGWVYVASEDSEGATLTVTPPDAQQLVKLKAFGFIGMMTRGMHHQQHHFMIAKGMNAHGG
jgi:hypothetical protein